MVFGPEGVLDLEKIHSCTPEGKGKIEEHFVAFALLPLRASPSFLRGLHQHLVHPGSMNFGPNGLKLRLQRNRDILQPG